MNIQRVLQVCVHIVYHCICMWCTCTQAVYIVCAGIVFLIESEGTYFTLTKQDVEPCYHGDHFRCACCDIFAVEFVWVIERISACCPLSLSLSPVEM